MYLNVADNIFISHHLLRIKISIINTRKSCDAYHLLVVLHFHFILFLFYFYSIFILYLFYIFFNFYHLFNAICDNLKPHFLIKRFFSFRRNSSNRCKFTGLRIFSCIINQMMNNHSANTFSLKLRQNDYFLEILIHSTVSNKSDFSANVLSHIPHPLL